MLTFPSKIFHKLWPKNTRSLPRNERMNYFEKKHQKLEIAQHFFGFQLAGAAPVLLFRATGVSSTSHHSKQAVNRQPGFRLKDSQSLLGTRKIYRHSNSIFLKNRKNENRKISYFRDFVENCRYQQIQNWGHPQEAFDVSFMGKFAIALLVMNDCITSNKNF